MSDWIVPVDDSGSTKALISIKVTPNSKTESLGGLFCDEAGKRWLKVSVQVVPEKGKANKAVVKALSKAVSVPKSSIELIKGDTARLKIFKMPINDNIMGALRALEA